MEDSPPDDPTPDALPPRLAEEFELLEVVGRGSTGTVFRARGSEGPELALKVLDRCRDSGAAARAGKEVAALADFEAPAWARVIAHGEVDEVPWVATEWVEGTPLDRLGPEEAYEALRAVADGLETLHRKGFVHGDVRPGNVLRDPEGRTVLVGAGFSVDGRPARAEDASRHTGYPLFLSPQVWLLKTVTLDADWFAWAVTVFWLYEGRFPFGREDLQRSGIVQSLPRVTFERLDKRSPLATLVKGLLAYVPQDRARTIAEVRGTLEEGEAPELAEEREPLERSPLPAPVPVVRRRPRRDAPAPEPSSRAPVVYALAAALALAVVAGLLMS